MDFEGLLDIWVRRSINHIEFSFPFRLAFVFNWIPKGLMEDMIDNSNENFPVIEGINSFTTSQLFAALQNDVTTVQQYNELLITQNPGSATQITNIFAQYHF